nr:MAG TPA: conotoxin [Bacteriophage sp.]
MISAARHQIASLLPVIALFCLPVFIALLILPMVIVSKPLLIY